MKSIKFAIGKSLLALAVLNSPLFGISLNNPMSFDTDGFADLSVYDYSNGAWAQSLSDASVEITQYKKNWGWGGKNLMPVPADYDNDGITDRAVYDTKNLVWYIRKSSVAGGDNTDATAGMLRKVDFGLKNSIAVPHDYDGDGIIDLAVYQPKTDGWWGIRRSTDGEKVYVQWGAVNCIPVPGYYLSTNKVNLALYNVEKSTTFNWFIMKDFGDLNSVQKYNWGLKDFLPIPADYDGDGYDELATYSPRASWWWIRNIRNDSTHDEGFGFRGDVPVPDEYNTSPGADLAVYRRSTGTWFIKDNGIPRANTASSNLKNDGVPQAEPTQQDTWTAHNWGYRNWHPSHLQYQVNSWYYVKKSADHLPIIYPADFNGTLWKTPNHSGGGTVVLLAPSYLSEYYDGLWAGMVISSDPAGEDIVGGDAGIGDIVAPYHDGRPAIRFHVLGTHFGSDPVYMVLFYKDGRRQPWYLPNPGLRTE